MRTAAAATTTATAHLDKSQNKYTYLRNKTKNGKTQQ